MVWRTAFISAVAVAVTLAVVALLVGWLRSDADVAKPKDNEVSIVVAAHAVPETELIVRGYVFIDARAGMLLCSARQGANRPACAGDVLQLEDLDTSRLALERAEDEKGGYDAWSTGEVVLLGTADGGAFLRVKDVLQG
jgi:hypothetical protein